jgi:hypothetical protein
MDETGAGCCQGERQIVKAASVAASFIRVRATPKRNEPGFKLKAEFWFQQSACQTAPSGGDLEDGADGGGGRPMEDRNPHHSKITRLDTDPFHEIEVMMT